MRFAQLVKRMRNVEKEEAERFGRAKLVELRVCLMDDSFSYDDVLSSLVIIPMLLKLRVRPQELALLLKPSPQRVMYGVHLLCSLSIIEEPISLINTLRTELTSYEAFFVRIALIFLSTSNDTLFDQLFDDVARGLRIKKNKMDLPVKERKMTNLWDENEDECTAPATKPVSLEEMFDKKLSSFTQCKSTNTQNKNKELISDKINKIPSTSYNIRSTSTFTAFVPSQEEVNLFINNCRSACLLNSCLKRKYLLDRIGNNEWTQNETIMYHSAIYSQIDVTDSVNNTLTLLANSPKTPTLSELALYSVCSRLIVVRLRHLLDKAIQAFSVHGDHVHESLLLNRLSLYACDYSYLDLFKATAEKVIAMGKIHCVLRLLADPHCLVLNGCTDWAIDIAQRGIERARIYSERIILNTLLPRSVLEESALRDPVDTESSSISSDTLNRCINSLGIECVALWLIDFDLVVPLLESYELSDDALEKLLIEARGNFDRILRLYRVKKFRDLIILLYPEELLSEKGFSIQELELPEGSRRGMCTYSLYSKGLVDAMDVDGMREELKTKWIENGYPKCKIDILKR